MSQVKKVVEPSCEKEKGSRNFTRADYALICDWLQLESNWEKLNGVQKKTKVGACPVVRSQAYVEMAEFINVNQKKGSKLQSVDKKSMKTRWLYYLKRYKTAKALTQDTSWGLSESDIAVDFRSVEEKLESECPHYSRMDALYQSHPNVADDQDYQSRTPASESLNVQQRGEGRQKDDALPMVVDSERPNVNTPLSKRSTPRTDVEYSPQLDELGEEVNLNHFVPDFMPINEADAVLDSIPTDSFEELLQRPTPEVIFEQVREGPLPTSRPRQRSHGGTGPQGASERTVEEDSQGRQPTSTDPPRPATTEPPRLVDNQQGRGATAAPAGRGRPASAAGKSTPYPNKKQIGESRHSINSSFVANLETQNEIKEKANLLRAEKFEQSRILDERKFQWQQQVHTSQREDQRQLDSKRLDWDRERFEKEQELRKAEMEASKEQKLVELEAARSDRASSEKMQMMLALISQGKSPEDVAAYMALLGC